MAFLAACHEIHRFACSLPVVTLTEENTLPARLYASHLANASSMPAFCQAEGDGSVHASVVLSVVDALMEAPVPDGFDSTKMADVVEEALRHATAADAMASMFTARARTMKSGDHLRDTMLLLVLTSPEHTIHDADRLFRMFCANEGASHEMTYHVEAAACVFLATSLRTFARLLTDIPDHLAHIVEMNADAKAIPSVLERILRAN